MPLVEQEMLTLSEFTTGFKWVRVTRSFVLCVCFVDRCLSCCPFLFWPLYCLFFFDVRILITPFVSSNSSYYIISCFISCHIKRYVYRCVFYMFIFVLFIIFTYYCQKKLLHWLPASASIDIVIMLIIVITWRSVIYSFGHCVVCSSLVYRIWLPPWYLPFYSRIGLAFATFSPKII